jgi:hypothetical protein
MHRIFTRLPAATALLLGLNLVGMPAAVANDAVSGVFTVQGRHWAVSTNGADIKWPEADQYCAELRLGGHSDWRLPTLEQLETLQDSRVESGIREPVQLDGCCLWSSTSLEDLAAEDGDEIAGEPSMYRWGFMFDGGLRYYAVHVFDDGQALCTRGE